MICSLKRLGSVVKLLRRVHFWHLVFLFLCKHAVTIPVALTKAMCICAPVSPLGTSWIGVWPMFCLSKLLEWDGIFTLPRFWQEHMVLLVVHHQGPSCTFVWPGWSVVRCTLLQLLYFILWYDSRWLQRNARLHGLATTSPQAWWFSWTASNIQGSLGCTYV